MTLPAFAAKCERLQQSILSWYSAPARRSVANPPHAAAASVDGTDGQTDTGPLRVASKRGNNGKICIGVENMTTT